MKPILILLPLLILLSLASCDKVREVQPKTMDSVPLGVVQAVHQAFPAAQSVTFTNLEKGRTWQADFTQSAARFAAYLKANGQFLETTRQTTTLPEPASSYIRKMFPGATIELIAESLYDGQVTAYKVSILDAKTTRTILFNQLGQVVLVTDESPSGSTTATYPVAQVDLPAAIQDYMTKTMGTAYSFERAGVVLNGNQKTYTVIVRKEATLSAFYFDETGNPFGPVICQPVAYGDSFRR
jgi:hypothetical protein